VRELDLRRLIAGRCEKDECVAALLVLRSPDLTQPERVAVELERRIQVGDADHGVEVFHSALRACWLSSRWPTGYWQEGAARDRRHITLWPSPVAPDKARSALAGRQLAR